MNTQVQEYGTFETQMSELKDSCNFIPSTDTKEGYQKSKRLALDGRKIINRLDEKRKEINQELVDKKAANDNECKRIQSMITDAIDPHLVA
ncbi:MAG: hypothetical protein V3W52_17035, partial [Syntrophobacteria bacterium]